MADFESNLNLNVEASEIEIEDKFKLSGEELDNIAGGCGEDDPYKTCDDCATGDNQPDGGSKDKEVDAILGNAGTNLIAGVEPR